MIRVAPPSMRKRYFQPGRWCLIWKTPKEMRPEKAPEWLEEYAIMRGVLTSDGDHAVEDAQSEGNLVAFVELREVEDHPG